MPTFKRVSLAGSEELFRPTRPQVVTDTDDVIRETVDRHEKVKEVVLRTLSFTPDDSTPGYHRLKVRVADREAHVRARPGYWSSQASVQ